MIGRTTLTVLVFSMLFGFSVQAQKHAVVSDMVVQNQYEELAEIRLSDTLAFFRVIETVLSRKVGDFRVDYPRGRKISFIDPRTEMTLAGASKKYMEYYRERSEARKVDHDYRVEVRTRISDNWKGARNDMQVVTHVVVKDRLGKTVDRGTGKVTLVIPPAEVKSDELLIDRVPIMSAFPVQEKELEQAIRKSIELVWEENNTVETETSGRSVTHDYDAFIEKAIGYRILAPNNFLKNNSSRLKILGIITFTRKRPLMITRIPDKRSGVLNFREAKITDIDLNLGRENIFLSKRYQRHFRMDLQMPGLPAPVYAVRGVFNDNRDFIGGVWGSSPRLIVKRKDGEESGKLHFSTRDTRSGETTITYTRSLGRVFHPHATLAGEISGRTLEVASNPLCYNAVEVKLDGKRAGLITHPVTNRKAMRKNKKLMPFLLYVSPDLSKEDEALVLQAFQFNRLAYMIQDYQDQVAGRSPEVE